MSATLCCVGRTPRSRLSNSELAGRRSSCFETAHLGHLACARPCGRRLSSLSRTIVYCLRPDSQPSDRVGPTRLSLLRVQPTASHPRLRRRGVLRRRASTQTHVQVPNTDVRRRAIPGQSRGGIRPDLVPPIDVGVESAGPQSSLGARRGRERQVRLPAGGKVVGRQICRGGHGDRGGLLGLGAGDVGQVALEVAAIANDRTNTIVFPFPLEAGTILSGLRNTK